MHVTSPSIHSFADLHRALARGEPVLTLFSGGLDSSYLIHVLAQAGCRVTALAVDVGDDDQAPQALQAITDHLGAELVVADARQEFVQQAVLPALRAQARYLGSFPISASLSRPVMARRAVELARERGCQAIVHTANRSQNSLRRLNGALGQLGFAGAYGTPYENDPVSRREKMAALAACGLDGFRSRGISGDANLWCREFESGELDNPEAFWAPESLYRWSRSAPAPAFCSIRFEAGVPVALNGEPLDALRLIGRLNTQAGAFRLGRFSGLEHLEGGEKVLEVREAPAAQVLLEAARQLETATLPAEALREKLHAEQLWVREAVEGRWFGPLRSAAQAFIDSLSAAVTGTVSLRLREGGLDMCAIKADRPLYLTDRDGWEQRARRGAPDHGEPTVTHLNHAAAVAGE